MHYAHCSISGLPSSLPRGVHTLHGCVRWGLSEGCGHGGPGVCLGDGQTKAEELPSQGTFLKNLTIIRLLKLCQTLSFTRYETRFKLTFVTVGFVETLGGLWTFVGQAEVGECTILPTPTFHTLATVI